MNNSLQKADLSRMSSAARRRALGLRAPYHDPPQPEPPHPSRKHAPAKAGWLEMEILRILWDTVTEDRECPTNTQLTDWLGSDHEDSVRRSTHALQNRGLIKIDQAGNRLRRRIYVAPLSRWTRWSHRRTLDRRVRKEDRPELT